MGAGSDSPRKVLGGIDMADYSRLYMFPGGTPTLGARKLDVEKEASQQQSLQAALDFREKKRQFDLGYGLEKRKNDYEVNRPYFEPSSGGGSGGSDTKTISADIRDKTIASFRLGAMNYPNYDFKGAFDKANAHGVFDSVAPEDMAKILAEAASQTKAQASAAGSGTMTPEELKKLMSMFGK